MLGSGDGGGGVWTRTLLTTFDLVVGAGSRAWSSPGIELMDSRKAAEEGACGRWEKAEVNVLLRNGLVEFSAMVTGAFGLATASGDGGTMGRGERTIEAGKAS